MTSSYAALDERYLHPMTDPADRGRLTVLVRGQGIRLEDAEGRSYIDGLAGLWNVNLGHGREELVEAAADQMRRLAFANTYSGYANAPALELAARLEALAYPGLRASFLATSGVDANEAAFKTARYFWRRRGRPAKVKVDLAGARVSRRDDRGHERDRDSRLRPDVRAPARGVPPRPLALPVPLRFRPARRGTRGGRRPRAGGDDPPRRAGHGGGLPGRAGAGRGRGHRPAGRLLPAGAGDPGPARRAPDRRRDHHGVRPDGGVVRADALGRAAGHLHLRQGRHQRVLAARRNDGERGDRARDPRGAGVGAVGPLVDLRRAPGLLRGGAPDAGRPGARAAGPARRPAGSLSAGPAAHPRGPRLRRRGARARSHGGRRAGGRPWNEGGLRPRSSRGRCGSCGTRRRPGSCSGRAARW